MSDQNINSRLKQLNSVLSQSSCPVLYWMTREQRVQDNWGLWYAQQQANEKNQPVVVVFALREDLIEANGTARMLDFMLGGLREVEHDLKRLNIPFVLWIGNPVAGVVEVAQIIKASQVVVDQFPLRIYQEWQKELVSRLSISITQVDGHNVVPVWVASNKQEYAARTIRPKITRLLPDCLVEIPSVKKQNWKLSSEVVDQLRQVQKDWLCRHPVPMNSESTSQIFQHSRHSELDSGSQKSQKVSNDAGNQLEDQIGLRINSKWQIDWTKVRYLVKVDESIKPTDFIPGEKAAAGVLDDFINSRLEAYDAKRNDPTAAALSNLSPYLHFGQISAQRVALAVENSSASQQTKTEFLEELIIRRELADNFCYYNSDYDSLTGAPAWAQKTLSDHQSDLREYIYTLDQFAQAQTHDPLWNAAQTELLLTGKMHGYMRMYWAKKILEWSITPQQAIEIAINLNDRYSLDGRDPNGYVGILWSIAGLHDRPWFKRPIFGSIRYMSAAGCQKKFDVKTYIATWLNLENYNYSTQSKSTSVSKSWLLFRDRPNQLSTQKIYCYVDESGQDTYGRLFVVGVIVAGSEHEQLINLCEQVESKSGKKKIKWVKTKFDIRLKYIQSVISSPLIKGKLFFCKHQESKDYFALTIETIVKAISKQNLEPYKVSVFYDGLPRSVERKTAYQLRQFQIPIRKVRGVKKDENNALIRLADSLCGLVRLAEERDGKARKLLSLAIKQRVIIELE